MILRGRLSYGFLLAAWGLLVGWQVMEHLRVREHARSELINRGKDISTTLGVVLRSQRHFGVISRERLESALADLVKQPGELNGVAMLNQVGDVRASAGSIDSDFLPKADARTAVYWGDETMVLMNLMDLGTSVTSEIERTNPAIVVSREDFARPPGTNRLSAPQPTVRPEPADGPSSFDTNAPPPPPGGRYGFNRGENRDGREGRGEGRGGRPRWQARPPWMSEEEFKSMIQKQGVHSFVIEMSTNVMRSVCRADLWMRSIIILLGTLAAAGSILALSNMRKFSELEVRLVRASQQNLHLKEMNLAAAGLAHETRNPLNIVRGLAQMISKRDDVSTEIRSKTQQIVEESDRVTAQLNEFINYSKPREVRRSAVGLGGVVGEVTRALNADLEEKKLKLQSNNVNLTIEADEQMLRQALFNLLLNATQAVQVGGEIQVAASRNGTEAVLEVRDNGPGVPVERRNEIFKPYFTTNEKGTGLGLAVVQQIILAHGWEIECAANDPHGAVFRIRHLKLVGQN